MAPKKAGSKYVLVLKKKYRELRFDRIEFAAQGHKLGKEIKRLQHDLDATTKTKEGLKGVLRHKEDQVAQRNKFVNELQEKIVILKEKLKHRNG